MSTVQLTTIDMKVNRFETKLQFFLIAALVLMSGWCLRSQAQDSRSNTLTTQQQFAQDPESKDSALLEIVRNSTERFKDVKVAERAGYHLQFGCVSGPDFGAMGLHFINGDLVNHGEIDATRPQIVLYEPNSDGSLRLTGADYLVLADQWDKNNQGPPELMGQIFQYFESPNRFGLPAFYTLHVWAWKDNPNGAFVNWHPKVKCQQFGGESFN
jgi:hypothetical protein